MISYSGPNVLIWRKAVRPSLFNNILEASSSAPATQLPPLDSRRKIKRALSLIGTSIV